MSEKLHVILDTDAFNEIDDQFAIAYLLKGQKVVVEAINACPFINEKVQTVKEGMEKSYNEILKIINLCQIDSDLLVNKGAETFLSNDQEPVISQAAKCIVEKSKNFTFQNPLVIVAIGALTNVASAILLDNSIVDRIKVVFLGGVGKEFREISSEFNLREDIYAAQIVFKKVKKLVMLPCQGVVYELRTTRYELEHWLLNKNALCTYLVENTIKEAESSLKGRPWSRVIWDISAIAYLYNENNHLLLTKKEKRFYPVNSNNYEYIDGEDIEYVYRVFRDLIFEDLFKLITK